MLAAAFHGDRGGAQVCLWDPVTSSVQTTLGHRDKVTAVAFSPDGALLATASAAGTERIWDPGVGEFLVRR